MLDRRRSKSINYANLLSVHQSFFIHRDFLTHIILSLDYAVVKKLLGNKGTVRALSTFVSTKDNQEYVVSAGCDRHVRIFDPNCEYQKFSEVSHCYLKQKLNSILISENSNN